MYCIHNTIVLPCSIELHADFSQAKFFHVVRVDGISGAILINPCALYQTEIEATQAALCESLSRAAAHASRLRELSTQPKP